MLDGSKKVRGPRDGSRLRAEGMGLNLTSCLSSWASKRLLKEN